MAFSTHVPFTCPWPLSPTCLPALLSSPLHSIFLSTLLYSPSYYTFCYIALSSPLHSPLWYTLPSNLLSTQATQMVQVARAPAGWCGSH